jgi:hypothetical protein
VFDSRIELVDGEGFASHKVIQLVGRRGIEEAISDPSTSLNTSGGSVIADWIGEARDVLL